MLELRYIESNPNGGSYCYFPYRWTSETSIVIENFYLPRQASDGRGRNLITVGPGRFQASGDGLSIEPPQGDNAKLIVYFGYYRNGGTPSTMYYTLEYTAPSNVIEGKLEIGNAYIKLNNSIVATGTTYTGTKITMQQDLCFLNSFNWSWNYIRGAKCGKVSFYENGVLSATYTPYEDDNGVAGYYDENNGVMIYSVSDPWVSGPAASSIIAEASKTVLSNTGETISISVSCENAWTVTGDTFLTLSSTGDTGSTTITATAPSYTGATARTDTLTFTDSVTGDEWEIDIKQKKYSTGQPFYLGADEIVEIYLGADDITEAYLGEDLVFSSSSGPTPPPTPTGSTRTLTISNIPTPPIPTGGEDEHVYIYLVTPIDAEQGIYANMDFKKEYVNDEYVVSMTMDDGNGNPVTGYTTAYTNSALTISGPWGDDVNIYYDYYDDINCEQVPYDDLSVEGETFTGDTISLAFPTLEVNAECQCGKDGGDWDYDNNVCVHPTGLLLRLSSIPDDGNVHTVTITDADSRECTLSIDMSDHSYTESADADDKYSVHMENEDLANSTAEWMIEGNMYGTYVITVDGTPLPNEPDYDGSGNFVLVTYDYNDDTMTNYCSRDAFDCENGGGTYDCQTGECAENI